MLKTLKSFLLTTTAVLTLVLGLSTIVANPTVSAAAPTRDTKDALKDICDKLGTFVAHNTHIYKDNCDADFITQAAQDAAVEYICSLHGPSPGDKKLEDECKAYDAVKPVVPQVDNASCAANPSQDGCDGITRAHECSVNACDLVEKYVNPGVNLVSGIFTLIAVISLMMGGIQYASSAGDAQKVTAAKKRISNTIYAIIAYAFLFTFLQWLIPGGLFRN